MTRGTHTEGGTWKTPKLVGWLILFMIVSMILIACLTGCGTPGATGATQLEVQKGDAALRLNNTYSNALPSGVQTNK
jgi:hypothetical protein